MTTSSPGVVSLGSVHTLPLIDDTTIYLLGYVMPWPTAVGVPPDEMMKDRKLDFIMRFYDPEIRNHWTAACGSKTYT